MTKTKKEKDTYGQPVIYVQECEKFLYEEQTEKCRNKYLSFKSDDEIFVYIKKFMAKK